MGMGSQGERGVDLRSGDGGGGVGAVLASGKDGERNGWDAQADGGELEQNRQADGEVVRSHFGNAGFIVIWLYLEKVCSGKSGRYSENPKSLI